PGHERDGGREDTDCDDEEDEAQRDRTESRRTGEQDPEDDEAHRRDHREDAAHPPGTIVAVEPAGEDRQANRLADPHGQEPVDERAERIAGGRVGAGDPAAAETERRAPDLRAREERADEAEGSRPQPDRARVLQAADRATDLPPREPGHHGRGDEEDAGCGEGSAGDERAELELGKQGLFPWDEKRVYPFVGY